MPNPIISGMNPDDHELARLYRLQVRELEDFALFVADPQGRILTWNRGVETTFGYTEQEWIGQHAGIIFTEEDRGRSILESEMEVAVNRGRAVDIRWHLRKDGTRVYMTGVLKALRDEKGELIGYSKIFIDDTARKHLEDALTQSNADLQQFAFIASHDMQEPLRTIQNFAELLDRRYGGQLDKNANEFLHFISDAAQRMTLLIGDLLAYSRLAEEESRATSVHLDEDLETAVALLRASVEESGAVITHDALPNVEVDRGQMVRLFQNLLGNAIKFRKPVGRPNIHVSADHRENEWIIRVQDDGIGFSPEHADMIFAPFKRLHTSQEYPGTGLGLAACKRIVQRYGGQIGAESNPGEGSTFWFTIPVSDSDQERFAHQESRPDV